MDNQNSNNSTYKNNIIKFACTLGAGASLGYFIYKQFFSNKTKKLQVESL